MKFWDSSALVLLVLEQTGSKAARALYRADPALAVWALTRVELVSAAQRLHREGDLDDRALASALRRIDLLIARATEVTVLEVVRQRAERALGLHPLRAADAMQLAAALALVDDRPRNRHFVVVDRRLAEAATREGFSVTTL